MKKPAGARWADLDFAIDLTSQSPDNMLESDKIQARVGLGVTIYTPFPVNNDNIVIKSFQITNESVLWHKLKSHLRNHAKLYFLS